MSRKNQNSVHGRNGGRRNVKRNAYEPVDEAEVRFLLNEDARMFRRSTVR